MTEDEQRLFDENIRQASAVLRNVAAQGMEDNLKFNADSLDAMRVGLDRLTDAADIFAGTYEYRKQAKAH